ncbi:MAG: 3-hydroxyacyl-CoA dehydrogenase NAD-binding domain-containing protein [Steroidobacterales bacterium]
MIQSTLSGSVAVIVFSNPPVNALSVTAGLLDGLITAVSAAVKDPAARAIVIAADGKIFSAGADIAEFDTAPERVDVLRNLGSDVIEASPKPVVIAIHGMALGGGLETALCGHYRICAPGTQLGFPEINLGLLPGAGGTQRMPRLIGAAAALRMMLSGQSIDAAEALKQGLIDRIAGGELRTEAIRFAEEVASKGPRRTKDQSVGADFAAAIATARSRDVQPGRNQAPAFIVDCIEAACTRSFADGLAIERERFATLMHSESSHGLRHVFFGRREVTRIPGMTAAAPARPPDSVAVIGGGLMGTGITIALLNAGLKVHLVETRAEALEKSRATIAQTIRRDVEKGRISTATADRRLASLTSGGEMSAIHGADLVIEAVYESMQVKHDVFLAMDAHASANAILASNTSTLNLDQIAAATRRPERVVGLHFFSPANVMKLLEIVRGAKTAPEVLAAAAAFGKAIGKVAVVAGVCDGFIGNRMFEEYLRQAYYLLEEGALPAHVDAALERFGMAMGPLRVMDLVGQDIGWSIRKRRAIEQPDRPYSKLPDMICEMGRYGQKTGSGFYRYTDGRTASPDPEIDALIVAHSKTLGIARRTIDDEEIVERCIYALVNEGAYILEEGIAYRPVDVDMVTVFGYGFPADRGGPMFYARRRGLAQVVSRMQQFATGVNGWPWKPAPSLLKGSN